jgi:hypothetical protein
MGRDEDINGTIPVPGFTMGIVVVVMYMDNVKSIIDCGGNR